MPTSKRLIAPVTVMFGTIVAAVAFAMPANAADPVYPPPAGNAVLGTSAVTPAIAVAPVAVAGVSAEAANDELAFTGMAVAGIGALGGLLLVGGTTLVVAGRRRKTDS
jgi:hypothetical protein